MFWFKSECCVSYYYFRYTYNMFQAVCLLRTKSLLPQQLFLIHPNDIIGYNWCNKGHSIKFYWCAFVRKSNIASFPQRFLNVLNVSILTRWAFQIYKKLIKNKSMSQQKVICHWDIYYLVLHSFVMMRYFSETLIIKRII